MQTSQAIKILQKLIKLVEYIFVDSEPVSEYEYLGSTKCKIAFSVQYQSVRDKLIKKVKKQYPKANGVIFHFHDGGTDLADAIYIK